jgi:hypothetical protein
MYITGDLSDYEARLHALTRSTGDLALFELERTNYTNLPSSGLYVKWDREEDKKRGIFKLPGFGG